MDHVLHNVCFRMCRSKRTRRHTTSQVAARRSWFCTCKAISTWGTPATAGGIQTHDTISPYGGALCGVFLSSFVLCFSFSFLFPRAPFRLTCVPPLNKQSSVCSSPSELSLSGRGKSFPCRQSSHRSQRDSGCSF